ncbi:MAG: hypothetical protein QXJ17_04465 [Nitrososphaeria archaeon]
MKKLVLALAAVILSAAVVVGFSRIQYVSEDGYISIERVEVRVGRFDFINVKPISFKTMLYDVIEALAWYKPASGSNYIKPQNLGSLQRYVPPRRNVFYAQGRTWMVYSNSSSSICYTSSVDGVSWANPASLGVTPNYPPVCFFDGTYVHIAFQKGSSLYLCYVRGTPNSDGTITFGTVQDAIATASNYIPTSVTVDSNGYPWIGYRYSTDASNWYPYVIKNSRNDGTWATASGFPYQLSTYADAMWVVEVAPLTSGKMVAFYTSSSRYVYAKSWTGSAWNSQAQAQYAYASTYTYPFASSASVGDTAYLTYARATTTYLTLVKYTYSLNSFSNVVDVEANAISNCVASLTYDAALNLIYIIYDNFPSAGVFYKIYNLTSSTLSDRVQVCSDTDIVVTSLSTFYKRGSSSDPVSAAFAAGASDPRSIRHVFIQASPQTQFQVSVSSLQVSGKYVKSKASSVLDSANVTIRVYHNVDSNSSWVLAGQYNLVNDTLLPYSTSFSTQWYNLLSEGYSTGSHTYYVKVEAVIQAVDAISGERFTSTAYIVASMPLKWENMAILGRLEVVDTNMHETWGVPLYASLFSIAVICSAYILHRRGKERD